MTGAAHRAGGAAGSGGLRAAAPAEHPGHGRGRQRHAGKAPSCPTATAPNGWSCCTAVSRRRAMAGGGIGGLEGRGVLCRGPRRRGAATRATGDIQRTTPVSRASSAWVRSTGGLLARTTAHRLHQGAPATPRRTGCLPLCATKDRHRSSRRFGAGPEELSPEATSHGGLAPRPARPVPAQAVLRTAVPGHRRPKGLQPPRSRYRPSA